MLTQRFDMALLVASDLHRRQTRKQTTIPYLSHLLIVAGTVLEEGGDEDTAIAALLHDAIEDQGGAEARERIALLFGERVAELVDSVSDTDQDPKPPWRERKEAYLAAIPGKSEEALLIAVADKLHNARSTLAEWRIVGNEVWNKFNAPKAEQAWFYASFLQKAFENPWCPEALACQLDDVCSELFSTP